MDRLRKAGLGWTQWKVDDAREDRGYRGHVPSDNSDQQHLINFSGIMAAFGF